MKKKLVTLVFSSDDCELSILALLLSTNFYRAVKASTTEMVMELFKAQEPDLVILDVGFQWFTVNDISKRMKAIRPWVPVALLGEPNNDFTHSADYFIDKEDTSTGELLGKIKMMIARKAEPHIVKVA